MYIYIYTYYMYSYYWYVLVQKCDYYTLVLLITITSVHCMDGSIRIVISEWSSSFQSRHVLKTEMCIGVKLHPQYLYSLSNSVKADAHQGTISAQVGSSSVEGDLVKAASA